MAANEFGPFETERQALATRAAAIIRAAFDAHPGVGAGDPEALKVMTDACAECGVDLGRMDLSTLQDIAWRETFEVVSLAGLIRRAFEAGKAAALEGAETEWGARYRAAGGSLSAMVLCGHEPEAESTARSLAGTSRRDELTGITLSRQVTPWKEVPGA